MIEKEVQGLDLKKAQQREVYRLKDLSHYTQVACLFEYPDAKFPKRVALLKELLDEKCPAAAKEVQNFLRLFLVN